MKIYFAGSIRGGRKDRELYLKIIDYLTIYGKVLTEHIGDKNISEFGEDTIDDNFIHNRDLEWLKESDIVIAEVTNPSLGVGYEIAKAIDMDKKVFCFFKENSNNSLSAMISGSPNIKTIYYDNIDTIKKQIDNIFKY